MADYNWRHEQQRAFVEAMKETKVWIPDNWKCVYCGHDMSKSFDTWFHGRIAMAFIPKSKGGSDELENLKTACGACNAYKGNLVFSSVEEAALWLKINREECSLPWFKTFVTKSERTWNRDVQPLELFKAQVLTKPGMAKL